MNDNDIYSADFTRSLPPPLKDDQEINALGRVIAEQLQITARQIQQNIIYDGHCTITSGFNTFDVYYTNGVIDSVEKGGETLYPAPAVPVNDNPLISCGLIVNDVKSGSGEKIGEYAYIEISKDQLKEVTAEDYKEFSETVVKDSGYNWVAIICDDGTGICFPGSMYYVAQYGKQDTDGGILEVVGTIALDENGGYTYEPVE